MEKNEMGGPVPGTEPKLTAVWKAYRLEDKATPEQVEAYNKLRGQLIEAVKVKAIEMQKPELGVGLLEQCLGVDESEIDPNAIQVYKEWIPNEAEIEAARIISRAFSAALEVQGSDFYGMSVEYSLRTMVAYKDKEVREKMERELLPGEKLAFNFLQQIDVSSNYVNNPDWVRQEQLFLNGKTDENWQKGSYRTIIPGARLEFEDRSPDKSRGMEPVLIINK